MRGLNTEVTRSLTSAAMVLVELVEDQHGRDEHAAVTQVHGPREEVSKGNFGRSQVRVPGLIEGEREASAGSHHG